MALGGKTNAINDGDLNLTFHNPALLKKGMDNHLLFNYVNYFADISYGYVSYSIPNQTGINLAAGLTYLDYGEFQKADETGMLQGKFKASEYALNLIASKAIDTNFTVGVNLKPVLSHLEEYSSSGIALDIGATYTDTSGLFSASLVLKNIGFQIQPYHPDHRESLPFDIQLGASYKLRHAPFRFVAVFDHLEQPDLTYQEPDYDLVGYSYNQATYQDRPKFEQVLDHVMRHTILGVEIIPLKNFYVRFGYNYRRRQEMKIDSRVSTVGFSWGFGIKIYKFYLNYGSGNYHLAGTTNHFSIRTDLNKLFSW
jgi:hypothetical protein